MPWILGGLLVVLGIVLAILFVMDRKMMTNELDAVLERRSASAAGGELEVSYFRVPAASSGKGRVVYVHGSPGNSSAWASYLKSPVADTEAIALDRPGFGGTLPMRPEPSLRMQAQAIEPFLAAVDGDASDLAAAEPPVLVGHSIGGPVVVRAAIDFPERVGAIVIVAGSVDPEMEEMRWYHHAAQAPVIRSVIPTSLFHSNEEIVPLAAELEAMKGQWDQIRCPVYIMHARNDSLVPFGNVAFMERILPPGTRQEMVLLDDGDHFLPWNNEPLLRQVIQSALSNLQGE
jgi:pimeloyl-ACP methyl ester carboxylesterase